METMRNKKSIVLFFSILLALLLCSGIFALIVSALDEPNEDNVVASVTIGDSTTYYSNLSDAMNAWGDGTLTLLKDVSGTQITVTSGTKVLDLNNHSITYTGGSVVFINGGALTIQDTSPTKTTHYYIPNQTGVATLSDTPTDYFFTGGYITNGGYYVARGGGLHITGGDVVFSSGTIFANSAGWGGGIYTAGESGSLTIEGSAAVIGNYSSGDWTSGGGAFFEGKFLVKMTGGSIRHNSAQYNGGGFRDNLTNGGMFEMTGGEITGNYSGNDQGNGFCFDQATTFHIGGTARIIGNQGTNDTYFYNDRYLTIVSPFEEGALIGVVFQSGAGTFTSGWSTYMEGKNPADYFVSNNKDYDIILKNGEVAIGVKPHEHDGVTFEKWTSTNSLPSSAGNYYLAADVTISSTWNVPSGTTNICLNDHKIAYSGSSGSVIRINSGSTLNLFDCGTTEHYYYIGATSTYNSNCLGAIVASQSDTNYVNAERRGSFVGGYITGGYGTNYSGSTVFGGGVFVDGGSFVLNGGCIFGNRLSVRDGGNGGGGVAVRKTSSSFVMNGGYIIGNHAGRFGGGIRIDGGSFTMNGGEIRHNTANTPGSGGAGCGGGLHMGGLDGGATVKITGGIIAGNFAGLKDGRGGGINAAGGTLTMTGGTVVGNNATLSGGGINGSFSLSGNVKITGNTVGGTFVADSDTLSGGTVNNVYLPTDKTIAITDALTTGAGIGITLESTTGKFISGWNTVMGNAEPATYFTSDNGNYGILLKDNEAQIDVVHVHNGVTFTKWTSTNSLPTSAGNYFLTADVTISSTWNVPSGTTNLCLNGHGIKKTGTGSAVKVGEGRTLKLYDCDTTTEHRYSVSNPAANGAGVATVNDSLTSNYQTFTGGYITGGYMTGGYQYGAGINLEGNGATLYMYGGTIIGNRLTAGSTGGGGVCVQDWDKSGGFYMYGGSIIGNTSNYGGGVYVRTGKMELHGGNISKNVANGNIGGGVLVFGGNSTLDVKGGSISENTAVHGGAIEASGDGTVIISGGSFTNNIATGKGGALTNQRTDGNTSPASFNISGAPVFSGNTAGGSANDIYLCNTAVLNLTAAMTNTTKIGITLQNGTGAFTSGWSTYMEGKDPADYFFSDNPDYLIKLSKSDEAEVFKLTFVVVIDGVTTYFDNYDDAFKAWCSGELGTIKIFESDDLTSEAIAQGATSVSLTIETKTEDAANHAEDIIENAKNKSALTFFDVKIEKTVGEETTLISETNNVIEVIVPYEKINKRGLTVYSYHDSQVRTFVESDTKEDGTFRVDKENKLIYIYAKKFSTYAIGYTPYYRVQTALSLGSYMGNASVAIQNVADANIAFTLESVNANLIVFPDVPKGQYTMTVTWEDVKTNTLTMTLTVGPNAVISAIAKQEAQSEDPITQIYAANIDTYENGKIKTVAYMDSGYENPVFMQVSLLNKAQEVNREIGFIPRKCYC